MGIDIYFTLLSADILGEAFTALNSAYSKERAIKRASSLGLPAPTDVVPLSAAKFATAIVAELDAVGDAEMTGDVVKAAALVSVCISKVEARASMGEGEGGREGHSTNSLHIPGYGGSATYRGTHARKCCRSFVICCEGRICTNLRPF